jgi:hypothetical protein
MQQISQPQIGPNSDLTVNNSTNTTTCRADTRIQIRLGGNVRVITLGRDLQDGETTNHACSDINSLYGVGSIQMTCQNGYTHVDLSNCRINEGPSEQQCQEEQEELEEEYEESYKKITEEITQFEEECSSTTCEDTARQTYESRVSSLQEQQEKLTQTLSTESNTLQTYRTRIEEAVKTEEDLREDIEETAKRCETMEHAEESLDRVRDAIHILDLCPGLGHLNFELPEWVGSWVVLDVLSELRDSEIDAEMYTMCRGLTTQGGVPRPAETSEIQQGAVDGAPSTNTASVPLMGTCPGCEGIADSQSGVSHPSGHARVCWDPTSTLDQAGRRRDCGPGRKAVMCVLDKNGYSNDQTGFKVSSPSPAPGPSPSP